MRRRDTLELLLADIRQFTRRVAQRYPPAASPAAALGLYFCAKAYWLGTAVDLLCRNGLATEARVLIRTLVDHYITFRYILQEQEIRPNAFCAFDPIERMRWLKALREYNVLGIPTTQLDAWEAGIRADYNDVLPQFETTKGKPRETWHGSNLRQMATDVDPNLEKLYVYLFRDTSGSVHPTNRDTQHYLVAGSASPSAVLAAFSKARENSDFVLVWSCFLTLHLLAHLERAFHLGHDADISHLDGRLKEILERTIGPPRRLRLARWS